MEVDTGVFDGVGDLLAKSVGSAVSATVEREQVQFADRKCRED